MPFSSHQRGRKKSDELLLDPFLPAHARLVPRRAFRHANHRRPVAQAPTHRAPRRRARPTRHHHNSRLKLIQRPFQTPDQFGPAHIAARPLLDQRHALEAPGHRVIFPGIRRARARHLDGHQIARHRRSLQPGDVIRSKIIENDRNRNHGISPRSRKQAISRSPYFSNV